VPAGVQQKQERAIQTARSEQQHGQPRQNKRANRSHTQMEGMGHRLIRFGSIVKIAHFFRWLTPFPVGSGEYE
jgi:hypothetical protein